MATIEKTFTDKIQLGINLLFIAAITLAALAAMGAIIGKLGWDSAAPLVKQAFSQEATGTEIPITVQSTTVRNNKTIVISWLPPQKNVDGSAFDLTTLRGFNVIMKRPSDPDYAFHSVVKPVDNTNYDTLQVFQYVPEEGGNFCFQLRTQALDNLLSEKSAPVCVEVPEGVVPVTAPNVPRNITGRLVQ